MKTQFLVHRQLPLQAVEIHDGFWQDRMELIRNVTIPYMWDALNDSIPNIPKSGALHNFTVAADPSQGDFYGLVSQDSDLVKWMEAASYSLAVKPDSNLEKVLDRTIEILGKAQAEDGYLNSYYLIREDENRWSNLRESCELYCAGHLIEAGVAHYESTGKRNFLEIACKYADYIGTVFGMEVGQKKGYCGHAEIELALMKLYRTTSEEKYLRLAQYFIDERGQKPYYFSIEKNKMNDEQLMPFLVYALEEKDYRHSQSHMPVREQESADGHAVKAVYLYSAVADMAMETGEEKLLEACRKLWDSVVRKRMYITGGIGSSEYGEKFTFDYDLPNDENYAETCASIGLVFWAFRMLRLDGDSKYADVMERALYNGVLSGLSLDGCHFLYTNPLEVWPEACEHRKDKAHIHPVRQGWFDCPCCPPNLSRLISSLGQYLYTYGDNEIFTQLYQSSYARFSIGEREIGIVQNTNYPWEGHVHLCIETRDAVPFTLALRKPGWCNRIQFKINGKIISTDSLLHNGYVKIDRIWSDGDQVEVIMDMEVQKVYANPKIRYNGGKVALQRGPIVYCLEEADNGEALSSLFLDKNGVFESHSEKELLNGIVTITANGTRNEFADDSLYSTDGCKQKPVSIKAIPYFAWCNRTPGEMAVWINER